MCSWEVIIMKCLYMSASYSKSAITSTLVVLHVVVVNRTQSHNVMCPLMVCRWTTVGSARCWPRPASTWSAMPPQCPTTTTSTSD